MRDRLARRLRTLPLIIAFIALMVPVKIGAIWSGLDRLIAGSLGSTPAMASSAAAPSTSSADHGGGGHAATASQESLPKGDVSMSPPPAPEETCADQRFSPSEVKILERLAARRKELDAQAQEIERRHAQMLAVQARIDRKIEEMHALQTILEDLVKHHDEQQEAQLRSLVKIYENMKPADAARIFEELQMDTLLPVAARMRERKLAPIMAKMDPSKAKAITVELSKQRQLISSGSDTADQAG